VKVKTPAPTPEDPAIVAARQREQARADGAFISNTQSLLDDETRRRQRQFGRRVALTGADPGGGIATGSGSSGDGGFALTAGGFGGGGGGGGRFDIGPGQLS
jgi:hypothetical protein